MTISFVVNQCHGRFELSYRAMKYIAKRYPRSITETGSLSTRTETLQLHQTGQYTRKITYKTYLHHKDNMLYVVRGPEEAQVHSIPTRPNIDVRSHHAVVEAVEELGPKASTEKSELKVVERDLVLNADVERGLETNPMIGSV